MADCTYFGCDVAAHDPVYVEETEGDERVPAGQFCNYACLAQHIEAEGLQEDTYCSIDAK
jgi:hypothetical protein